MLAVVAALGFLAALGGFGVVVLRRSGPNLTTLESVAYGAPLGTVVGTLLILLLARVIGLTAATVTVGAAALMGALVVSLALPADVRSGRVGATELWARIGPTLAQLRCGYRSPSLVLFSALGVLLGGRPYVLGRGPCRQPCEHLWGSCGPPGQRDLFCIRGQFPASASALRGISAGVPPPQRPDGRSPDSTGT